MCAMKGSDIPRARKTGLDRKRMDKSLKYNVLRHLPGKRGRRYHRKYMGISARSKFDEALNCSAGKTCIDLGANVGEYTNIMAVKAKRVVAFEPDPWAHAQLRANVADLDNVMIESAAAGTWDGKVLLYRRTGFENNPASNSQSSSVIATKNNVCLEEAVEVEQIDFIAYLEILDENIGIVKIDIEGTEVELLENLFGRPDILKRIDYIFVETHESRIPGHEPRVKKLRKSAKHLDRPYINFYWN